MNVRYTCGVERDHLPAALGDTEDHQFSVCLSCGHIAMPQLDIDNLRQVAALCEESKEKGVKRNAQCGGIIATCGRCGVAPEQKKGKHPAIELYKCSTCDMAVCDSCCEGCDADDHDIQLD